MEDQGIFRPAIVIGFNEIFFFIEKVMACVFLDLQFLKYSCNIFR